MVAVIFGGLAGFLLCYQNIFRKILQKFSLSQDFLLQIGYTRWFTGRLTRVLGGLVSATFKNSERLWFDSISYNELSRGFAKSSKYQVYSVVRLNKILMIVFFRRLLAVVYF